MTAFLLRILGYVAVAFIATTPAYAALVTYDFAGSFGPPAALRPIPGVAEGDPFSGTFVFDGDVLVGGTLNVPNVPDPDPPGSGTPGFFSGPVTATSETSGSSFVTVSDGDGSIGESDSLFIQLKPTVPVPWPLGSGGGSITFWSILLTDSDGSVFPGNSFPSSAPDFTAWDETSFSMFREGSGCGDTNCSASGTLTSFQIRGSSSIPEPGSLELLLLALGVGVWSASRKRAYPK